MQKRRRISWIATIGIFVLPIFAQGIQSLQSSPENTLKRKSLLLSGKVTALDALTTALSAAGVPAGIATTRDCREDSKYTFSSSGPSLEDALRTIESTSHQYVWNVSDGLVNVSPIGGDPALLKLHIRKLEINSAPSIDEAANQIFSLHDVQKRIIELGLTPGLTRLGMSDLDRIGTRVESGKRLYSLKLTDVTLREALNTISRDEGKAVWEYRELHCNGKAEFQIQFLVR